MAEYESIMRAKTGGINLLAYQTHNDFEGKQELKDEYFKPLYEVRLAYQIQDDLSDFLGIKDRGLPGRDLKEGRNECINNAFLKNATNGERFLLQQFFSKKSESISEDDILIG